MAGKSEKQQVLEGCLEVGILCVLVSPGSFETDLLHPGVNATWGDSNFSSFLNNRKA